MQVIADLQLHSKYSRAVSPKMTIPNIAMWARRKGIGLVATGDWTHPLWMREIERDLVEIGNGLLKLKNEMIDVGSERLDLDVRKLKLDEKNQTSNFQFQDPVSNFQHPTSPLFLLATEVSCIYSQNGKGRRVHTLIWVPSLASAKKINQEMTKRGCNLMSDGRPIIGLSSIQLAELVLTIETKALIIPAHAWTPWFSLYGSMSGFDSIDEAFGTYAKNIYAIETGLSSSPAMNWRIKELDHRAIVSFSDAHSGPKLGREATVFEVPDNTLRYDSIYNAIKMPVSDLPSSDLRPQTSVVRSPAIAYTIEFYPEEGKYHWSGHRACNIRWGPKDTEKNGSTCPVCGKSLTQGVEQRVDELAGRSEASLQLTTINKQLTTRDTHIRMTASAAFPNRPPFVMLVPLQEIIAEAVMSPATSVKVQMLYTKLTDELGGEFSVLLGAAQEDIAAVAGDRVRAGIEKVRKGDIVIEPGYDGVFGLVRIWPRDKDGKVVDDSREQLTIFT